MSSSDLRLALLLIAVVISGCGDLDEQQSRSVVKKCVEAGGMPYRQSGLNREYWVKCEDIKP